MKFETKIFWVMTHHFNKNFHSEKSDQASLILPDTALVYGSNVSYDVCNKQKNKARARDLNRWDENGKND